LYAAVDYFKRLKEQNQVGTLLFLVLYTVASCVMFTLTVTEWKQKKDDATRRW
jgi:hypothetical protein